MILQVVQTYPNSDGIVHQPSEQDLTGSGNAAYMRLEPVLARVTNQEMQLECSLEEEIIHL